MDTEVKIISKYLSNVYDEKKRMSKKSAKRIVKLLKKSGYAITSLETLGELQDGVDTIKRNRR